MTARSEYRCSSPPLFRSQSPHRALKKLHWLRTSRGERWNCRTGHCRTGQLRTTSQGWTLQDWTLTDDFAGVAIAGLDNGGLDIDGLDNGGLDIDGRDVAGLDIVGLDIDGLDNDGRIRAGLSTRLTRLQPRAPTAQGAPERVMGFSLTWMHV